MPNTNLAREKPYRTKVLRSSMSVYLPWRDYTQHFIPSLLDIAGDCENKSMLRGNLWWWTQIGARKGVSDQDFVFKYVCISFINSMYPAFYFSFICRSWRSILFRQLSSIKVLLILCRLFLVSCLLMPFITVGLRRCRACRMENINGEPAKSRPNAIIAKKHLVSHLEI